MKASKDGLPLPECLESDTSSLLNRLWPFGSQSRELLYCSMQNYRAREKNKWKRKWAGQSAGDWGRVRDSVDDWHTWIQRSLPSVPEEVQSASIFSSLTGCKRVKSEHIVPELKIIRTSAVATISSFCPSSWQTHSCALKRKDLSDTHLLGGCDSEMDHVLHF